MNLIIDIGNTRTKLAVYSDEKMILSEATDELTVEHLKELRAKYPKIGATIISSVKDYPKVVRDFIHSNFNPFIELNHETRIPLVNKYNTPKTLGKDRIAVTVGANAIFPNQNLLVIDAGTAITYDLVNQSNEYIGGNISPGIQTRFKALNHFTGKLPLVDYNEDFDIIGKDTVSAIRAGVQQGVLFEIEQYITHFNNLYQNLQVIITGGDAKFFDKMLKNSIFVHFNLTMFGLNRILEYNVKET